MAVGSGLMLAAASGLVSPAAAGADPAGPTISGTQIKHCNGGAQPALYVGLYTGPEQSSKVSTTKSAADGEFVFTALVDASPISEIVPGAYFARVSAPGACASVPTQIEVAVDGEDVSGLRFDVVDTYNVEGTVTGCAAGAGNGLEGIELTAANSAGERVGRAVTDVDGNYELIRLPDWGENTVTVDPGPNCLAAAPTATVLLDGANATGVDFALESAPCAGSLASLGALGSLFGSLGSGSLAHCGSL